MIASDGQQKIGSLAEAAGVGPTYFARVMQSAFLSPALTTALLDGRYCPTLKANKLQHIDTARNE